MLAFAHNIIKRFNIHTDEKKKLNLRWKKYPQNILIIFWLYCVSLDLNLFAMDFIYFLPPLTTGIKETGRCTTSKKWRKKTILSFCSKWIKMPTQVNLIFWALFFSLLLLRLQEHNFIFNHLAKNSKAIWVHINFIHTPYRKKKRMKGRKKASNFLHHEKYALVCFFLSSPFFSPFVLQGLAGIE